MGLALLCLLIALCASAWQVMRTPDTPVAESLVVNDVSQLNPIRVSEIITPSDTREIVDAIKRHSGPISIGGARHSMGGQIAAQGGLHVDMRLLNRILEFRPDRKEITVQAGTRWRQIQEHIDRSNLSVQVMQSYADFTVGGSLSVNGHGRYLGMGPVISSVKSLTVALADGSVIEASPTHNTDVFNGVIGGYGGIGVIVEATLNLTDNRRIKRTDEIMSAAQYPRYFSERIRGASAIFHSAILYPNEFASLRSVTHFPSEAPLTIADRLIPGAQEYRFHRLAFWIISEWPAGQGIRRLIIDPIYFSGEAVTWRNYEASYDADELEPASRRTSTYALQEYFVPIDRFDDFVAALRLIVRRHPANIVNVSIRHSMPDHQSLLSWAPNERFAFVIYYKQGTSEEAKRAVGLWTRALIDAALKVGGTFYLPYQLHATGEQFRRGYPRFPEYVTLKRRVDPGNKFRNTLLDKYLRSSTSPH